MKKTHRISILLLLLAGVFNAFAQGTRTDTAAIRAVLRQQEAAWNRADIEGFMEGYWKSEDLEFVGKSGLQKGWQKTLDNYKKSYPGASAMGKLDFTILKIDLLGKKSAYIVGQWHLARPEKGDLQGYFTLLWKKINGAWVIVSDHSS
jgi:uncharacterized protein (TIGR02246 family)